MLVSSFFRCLVAAFALGSIVASASVMAQQLSQPAGPPTTTLQSDRAVPSRSDSNFSSPGQPDAAGLADAVQRPVGVEVSREMSAPAAPLSFGSASQKN